MVDSRDRQQLPHSKFKGIQVPFQNLELSHGCLFTIALDVSTQG